MDLSEYEDAGMFGGGFDTNHNYLRTCMGVGDIHDALAASANRTVAHRSLRAIPNVANMSNQELRVLSNGSFSGNVTLGCNDNVSPSYVSPNSMAYTEELNFQRPLRSRLGMSFGASSSGASGSSSPQLDPMDLRGPSPQEMDLRGPMPGAANPAERQPVAQRLGSAPRESAFSRLGARFGEPEEDEESSWVEESTIGDTECDLNDFYGNEEDEEEGYSDLYAPIQREEQVSYRPGIGYQAQYDPSYIERLESKYWELEEHISREKPHKNIVMVHRRDRANIICARLNEGYPEESPRALCITGVLEQHDRKALVDKFTYDESCVALVATDVGERCLNHMSDTELSYRYYCNFDVFCNLRERVLSSNKTFITPHGVRITDLW